MTPDQERARLVAAPRFEIIPVPDVLDRVVALPPGATVTVTASPRRGVDATVHLAETLAGSGFDAVPHLAARQFTDESQLGKVLGRLHRAGVRDLFVVGGDAPVPAGDFADGLALLKAIDATGYRFPSIGVPSYPEGHPVIDDDELWAALAAKQHYATYTVTQLCFDPAAITRFAATARDSGITLPVRVGVPGAVPAAKLIRMSLRVGVGDSLRFVHGNHSVLRRLFKPHGYRPDDILRGLVTHRTAGGTELAGLHFYTFNDTAATMRWLARARRGGSR